MIDRSCWIIVFGWYFWGKKVLDNFNLFTNRQCFSLTFVFKKTQQQWYSWFIYLYGRNKTLFLTFQCMDLIPLSFSFLSKYRKNKIDIISSNLLVLIPCKIADHIDFKSVWLLERLITSFFSMNETTASIAPHNIVHCHALTENSWIIDKSI